MRIEKALEKYTGGIGLWTTIAVRYSIQDSALTEHKTVLLHPKDEADLVRKWGYFAYSNGLAEDCAEEVFDLVESMKCLRYRGEVLEIVRKFAEYQSLKANLEGSRDGCLSVHSDIYDKDIINPWLDADERFTFRVIEDVILEFGEKLLNDFCDKVLNAHVVPGDEREVNTAVSVEEAVDNCLKIYKNEDVSMSDILASERFVNLSAEDAFQAYAVLMEKAEGDKFYHVRNQYTADMEITDIASGKPTGIFHQDNWYECDIWGVTDKYGLNHAQVRKLKDDIIHASTDWSDKTELLNDLALNIKREEGDTC